MRFNNIMPVKELQGYIEKIWLFESSGKMPAEDMKLVVPNGNIKLTISYRNGIVASMNGKTFSSKEQDITLTGLVDTPVILDMEQDCITETIGIEFNPQFVYRFFHFNLHEIQNGIYSLSDIMSGAGRQLTESIANANSTRQKIAMVQQFLLRQLMQQPEDAVFEYCVQQIQSTKGSVSLKQLEKKTGYSSRWLNMKFTDKLGVSPKNLSSILRFNHYYQAITANNDNPFIKNEFYTAYYDQSHFIKAFKRFTGLPPARFERQINNFGRIYYR
ncbi:MAG: helix-turn-helix domain-containing protein [Chitinophagaceae bacterium]